MSKYPHGLQLFYYSADFKMIENIFFSTKKPLKTQGLKRMYSMENTFYRYARRDGSLHII